MVNRTGRIVRFLALCLFIFPQIISAADKEQLLNFNISAQSVDGALQEFSSLSGIDVGYTADMTSGLKSTAVNGKMSVNEALKLILSGTGLVGEFSSDNTVTLERLGSEGDSASAEALSLDTLFVSGTKQSRYDFKIAESATGFKTDANELPRTVQVLPEQLVLDSYATDMNEVLSNAAGVTRSHGFGGAETGVNIRGFSNNRTFVDGGPVSRTYNIDVSEVESTEVVLGPASVLHGQVGPGGLINIITKQPQEEAAHALQIEFDEHGKRKAVVDSTGPINDDFQYRIVASVENSDSFREVKTTEGSSDQGTKNFSVSPSFRYTPDDDNTFTLRLNHTRKERQIDRGTVAVDDGFGNLSIADLPRERRLGTASDIRDSEESRIQFNWERQLNDNWLNKFQISFYKNEFDDYQARPIAGLNGTSIPTNPLVLLGSINPGAVLASNGFLVRTADTNIDVKESDFFISDSLVGDFELGGFENTLFIAANYHKRKIDDTDGFGLTPLFGSLFIPTTSIINIYDETQAFSAAVDQTVVSTSNESFEEYGLSIQNLSYLTDKLNLLLGLRYDHFENEINSTVFYERQANGTFLEVAPTNIKSDSSNQNLSGQIGVIYDLTDNFSIYGSYSESFTPNYPDVTGGFVNNSESDLEPEEAKQYEIGIKSSFFDDKLRVSVSAYDLTRENVLRYENQIAQLNGEESTKGVDITTTMQFVPGLNILATYSYLDTEIVDDNNASLNNEGNTPFSIPNNKFRIWGSYEVPKGRFAGLGIGLGAEYVDQRFGDNANTFTLPSYTIFDTSIWKYIPVGSHSKLRLQAGVKNLTDRDYYPANGSGNPYRINVGQPRTAYMTLRLEY